MAETVTLATLLSSVSTIVTSSVGWIASFMGVIESEPLMLMFVILPVVGLGIGLIKRLISL